MYDAVGRPPRAPDGKGHNTLTTLKKGANTGRTAIIQSLLNINLNFSDLYDIQRMRTNFKTL